MTAYERIPTLVLIDEDEARDGNTYPTRAFLLSHDLYSAARLYKDQEVISDQLLGRQPLGAQRLSVRISRGRVTPRVVEHLLRHGKCPMIFLQTLLVSGLIGCNPVPDQADLDGTRGGRVDVFFNDPGSRFENMWEPDAVDVMVELIDGATASIDFAVMGFGRDEVVDAFVRAHQRGIKVRMVGDAGHLYNSGYQTFMDLQISTCFW